jgi:putative ABC transport system ATP-binding protein
MNEILKTESVHKNYNGLEVVRNANLKLLQGDLAALLGPSGSGKSTLLGIMAGLEAPSRGRVCVDGRDLADMSEDELALFRREKVGFVFQAFHLISTLSALENVAFPLYPVDMSSTERTGRARTLLDQVGLGHRWKHRPAQLSGGERQRVAIARALINQPKLIFCDEPTGNLDSKTGREILDLLLDLNRKQGVSLFLVTHDDGIAQNAHRIFLMQDGEVLEQ